MPSPDLDLARRLVAGEEAAFEAFFADYFPRLYRFACSRLGDEDAAEDVTQATLIKALAKMSTYRGESALFTWLCTFCRHEISAWLEKAGKEATAVSLADDQEATRAALEAIVVLTRDDPAETYQRRELSRRVHAALDYLPKRHADALCWKYMEGLSVDEIGERLGVGYKAAESLLTRARLAFREAFAAINGAAPASVAPAALRPRTHD